MDGAGEWISDYQPTVGGANQRGRGKPPPEAKASPASVIPQSVSLAQARAMPKGSWVIAEGQITVPPGVLAEGTVYVQDAGVGVQLYLKAGMYPALKEGDWVRVKGKLTDYHGECEIEIMSGEDVQWLRPGVPLKPTSIKTGELGEAYEGRLLEIAGRVTGWDWETIYLDDSSGVAKVYFGRSERVEKPWVERGDLYLVVGVASQYASARPYQGGYRLLPRYPNDVLSSPSELPVTGQELAMDSLQTGEEDEGSVSWRIYGGQARHR